MGAAGDEVAVAERVIALSWEFAKAGTPNADHKAQLRAALRDLAALKETPVLSDRDPGDDPEDKIGTVDRFICRREGHVPSVTIKLASTIEVTSLVCTCVRCGKTFETKASA